MQKLLSLPPNLVQSFHELERVNRTDWFCTSDPVGKKLGSGGGTAWLLKECYNEFADLFFRVAGKREKNSVACRRTKPSSARLRTIGQDTDTGSCVPMGEGTTPWAELAFLTVASV